MTIFIAIPCTDFVRAFGRFTTPIARGSGTCHTHQAASLSGVLHVRVLGNLRIRRAKIVDGEFHPIGVPAASLLIHGLTLLRLAARLAGAAQVNEGAFPWGGLFGAEGEFDNAHRASRQSDPESTAADVERHVLDLPRLRQLPRIGRVSQASFERVQHALLPGLLC